jgi:hypothetical protein
VWEFFSRQPLFLWNLICTTTLTLIRRERVFCELVGLFYVFTPSNAACLDPLIESGFNSPWGIFFSSEICDKFAISGYRTQSDVLGVDVMITIFAIFCQLSANKLEFFLQKSML